jgi:signal peptidase II
MTFYLIALAIILLDQATKRVIVGTLQLGQGLPIVPGFFDLVFVLNPGAAFSFLATLPDSVRNPFFITISVTAVILILVYRTRHLQRHELASLSLALVLGGAIGNLIDRLRYGMVVDFLLVHVYEYHWPAFNVADAAISLGVTLMVLDMLLEWRRERKNVRRNA